MKDWVCSFNRMNHHTSLLQFLFRWLLLILHIEPVKPKKLCVKLWLFSYPSFKTCVLGAQKNRLIETVLLSTHNICFGWERRKIIFSYALLSGGPAYNLIIMELSNSFVRTNCFGVCDLVWFNPPILLIYTKSGFLRHTAICLWSIFIWHPVVVSV